MATCIYNTYGGDKNKSIRFISKSGDIKKWGETSVYTVTKETSIKRGFWSHLEYELEITEGWMPFMFTAEYQPKSHLYFYNYSNKGTFINAFIELAKYETGVELTPKQVADFYGEALEVAIKKSSDRLQSQYKAADDRQARLEKEAIGVQDLKLYKYFFWVKDGQISPLYCVNLSFNNKDFVTPPDKDFFYCALPSTKYREAYAEYEKHKGSPTEQTDCVQP